MSTTQSSPAMPDSSSTSSNTVTQSVVISETEGIYDRLIKLVYDAVAMIYQGLTINPYREQRVAMLIFLMAKICNEIAKLAARPSWPTAILFHGSGVIAFEALLWVIVGQLLWFIVINVPILLVALLCYYMDICKLLNISYRKIFGQEGLITADQMAHEGIGAEMTGIV